MSAATSTLLLAHRGDWRVAPENTIRAMVAALEIEGCDGVELDVRLSRDGVPVVIHDDTLDRVWRRSGHVAALDAAVLGGIGVPTLAAVLDALPVEAFADIELKGADHAVLTAGVLRSRRGDAPDCAIVSSFEPATLRSMRALLPGWRRWLNADDLSSSTVRLAEELGAVAVAAEWHAIDDRAVARARAAGVAVAAWTVRDRTTVDRLASLGVLAVCAEGEALPAV